MLFRVLEEHFLNGIAPSVSKELFGDVGTCGTLEVPNANTLERTDLLVVRTAFINVCVGLHVDSSVHTLEFDIVAVGSHLEVLAKNRELRQLPDHLRKQVNRNACTGDRASAIGCGKRRIRSVRTTAERVDSVVGIATKDLDIAAVDLKSVGAILTRRRSRRRSESEAGLLHRCLGLGPGFGGTDLGVDLGETSLALFEKLDGLNVLDTVVAKQDFVHLACQFVPLLAETPNVVAHYEDSLSAPRAEAYAPRETTEISWSIAERTVRTEGAPRL